MLERARMPVVLFPPLRSSGKRVASLTGVWTAFGVLTGLLVIPPTSLIALVSGVLAGTIVLCPLGLLLGLLGGEVKLSLAGGLAGAALGAFTALTLAPSGLTHVISVGLLSGGLAGATCSVLLAWVRSLSRVLPAFPHGHRRTPTGARFVYQAGSGPSAPGGSGPPAPPGGLA